MKLSTENFQVRYGGIGHGWFVVRIIRADGGYGREYQTTASGPYTTREQAEARARELAEAS